MTRQSLVVTVTGHRDLVETEVDGIRKRVRSLFDMLRTRYPDMQLKLLSPLAEGADQLAAEVALEMSVQLGVVLPMPVEEYLQDFHDAAAIERFHELCDKASEVFELDGNIAGVSHDDCYARLGVFQASHCHVLLAIWDGKDSGRLGGTSQVVRFHHDDIMSGYEPKSSVSQQMLVDDESDLVYHVVCSRDKEDGAPAEGLQPLDWSWFTKDENEPRSNELPAAHDVVFQRANEFSRDAERYSDSRAAGARSLLSTEGRALDIDGLENIDTAFCAADDLAVHYQKRTLHTLRVTHVLALAMGTLFVLYSDLLTQQSLLYLFLACFAASAAIQGFARARSWHRKYLDYRTLAEGLRVQFYWAMAGISQDDLATFSHDTFLRLQDPEVGWIRNTMRIAGTVNDARPHRDTAALLRVIEEWVGDADSGQLGYYRGKSRDRTRRHRVTQALGRLSLVTSAAIVVLFLVARETIPENLIDPLMVLMGVTLLLFGVRHAYAYATAERELIKQYQFMLRIFANARKRLLESDSEYRKRQVLMALGSSALDEHAQWILMHRDRSLEQSEIWRMGSGS
jgi:uncharacterized membrane protein HdeD (DUF308 family)